MSNDTRTQLAQAIVTWLQDPASSNAASPDKHAQLTTAATAISNAFNLEQQPAAPSAGLQTIYDVFLKTQQKMGAAAPVATGASASPSSQAGSSSTGTAAAPTPSPQDLSAADAHKTAGNKSMSAKDYGAAIASYSKAIDLNRSPIYYSNRAAAYSQVGQHEKAVEDAREAARIDPKFGKAYSRLGHALFSSGKFDEAVEAYQQGLLVDPENKLMQTGLETAKSQAAKAGGGSSSDVSGGRSPAATRGTDAGPGPGMGGFPGLGGGGMPDLGSLLNNPMMQQMAQSMMANGGMDQLMNNPMLRGMADRMGQGGGMPDMSQIQQIMRDPQMMAMARQFMGGAGGGGQGGAGGGQGGSGSRTGDDMFG